MRSLPMDIQWEDLALHKGHHVNLEGHLLTLVLNMGECRVPELGLGDQEARICLGQVVREWDRPTFLCHQVISFQMRPRISIRGSVRPYVRGSVCPSVSVKEKLRKSPKIIKK